MKYRLLGSIFGVMGLQLFVSAAFANAADTNGVRGLLPVSGQTVALSATNTSAGIDDTQHVSTIEAIPTPTAFHTGAVLLLVIVGGRSLRKLRLARIS